MNEILVRARIFLPSGYVEAVLGVVLGSTAARAKLNMQNTIPNAFMRDLNNNFFCLYFRTYKNSRLRARKA